MTSTARRGSTCDSKAGAQLHLVVPAPLVLGAGMPSFPSPVLRCESCPSMSPSSCLSHGEDGGGDGTWHGVEERLFGKHRGFPSVGVWSTPYAGKVIRGLNDLLPQNTAFVPLEMRSVNYRFCFVIGI